MTDISVIIPLLNEVDNIGPVYKKLMSDLEGLDRCFEVILVDDGSDDGTGEIIRGLAGDDARIKVILFRRNFGQTAALMAGIDHAQGEIIVAMDGDGQNDSSDISRLIERLGDGYDVVSGWRQKRKDSKVSRVIPSRAANWLASRVSGVHLNDYGCTLKAYRRDILRDVRIYGEMHRFIPIYASWEGARVTELPVNHHERTSGRSKYGFERTVKVALDLIVITFLSRFASRPSYLFGTFGLLNMILALLAGFYTIWLKFGEGKSFIDTPMPLLVVFLMTIGFMSIFIGLLAEMVMRTYYEAQGKPAYSIKETVNL
tara:strand:+ start:1088 stop:2032 length:945 start_codon:yes stop_codon:yes gene_type:complete